MEEQVKRILEDLKSKFEIVKQKYFKSSEESKELLEIIEKLSTEIEKLKEKQEILRNPKAYKRKVNKNLNRYAIISSILSLLYILFGIFIVNTLFNIIGVIVTYILGAACLGLAIVDVICLVKIFKIKRKNKLEIEEIINNNSLEEIEQLLFSKEKQLEQAKDKEKQLSIDIEKYGKTANDLATSHNILLENYGILSSPKEEVPKLEQLTRKRTLNNNFIAL